MMPRNIMLNYRTLSLLLCLTWGTPAKAQHHIRPEKTASGTKRPLDAALFRPNREKGWTIALDLTGEALSPGMGLLDLSADGGEPWFQASVNEVNGEQRVTFALRTDYKEQPLVVAFPMAMLERTRERKFLLRYRANSVDLFLNGVLVDQEWPIGNINTGDHPLLGLARTRSDLLIWSQPITDAAIVSLYGGASAIASRTDRLLGSEPKYVQYSRPRGYNTNAGDAMPFFHDGTFHLFFLLDRRQHHSKWGLGAHQWGHISSDDLVHWKHYPVALGIDYDWEGSICTGSVFFHRGRFYAFYATRMADRSEHLGMAESANAADFTKVIPTPFAEPQPPFVHGPNRDPYVFEANGKFHMLVTAAVPGSIGERSEGALEHLTSSDLSHWIVEPEPFLLSGSGDQPECSDLFHWGDWYYLLYSLSGVTHYKIAKLPLGPWSAPVRNILDGPEAIVMKAAAFRGGRYLLVGFLQHDRMYGGDLVFRELVQEADGTLGTKFPQEMIRSIHTTHASPDAQLSREHLRTTEISLTGDTQFTATVAAGADARFALDLGLEHATTWNERLVFDTANQTLAWTAPSGETAKATLQNVTDLSHPMTIMVVLHGTVADVLLNGHRTLVHRLASPPRSLSLTVLQGEVAVSHMTVGAPS